MGAIDSDMGKDSRLVLDGYVPGRCMLLLGDSQYHPTGGGLEVFFTGYPGRYFLHAVDLRRARGVGFERAYAGGIVCTSNLPADLGALGKAGYTQQFADTLHGNLLHMKQDFETTQTAARKAGAQRLLSLGIDDQAIAQVRMVVAVARSANLRPFLGRQVTELSSPRQVYRAIRLVCDAIAVADVRARLLALGIGADALAEVQAMKDKLGEEFITKHKARAEGRTATLPLLVAKAMIVADVAGVGLVAPVLLTEERAALYRTDRLFGAPAHRRKKPPAQPGPTPTPEPGGHPAPHPGHHPQGHGTTGHPGPGTPPSHGHPGHGHGHGQGPGAPQPGVTPPATPPGVLTGPPGPAPGPLPPPIAPGPGVVGGTPVPALPGPPAPPPAPGPTGTTAAPAAGTPVATHLQPAATLPPGTVITVPDPNGGPPTSGVVQLDGSVLWKPPAAPAPAAAPPAEPAQHETGRRHKR